MSAEQRQMFETTVAEDEADLALQLAALQGKARTRTLAHITQDPAETATQAAAARSPAALRASPRARLHHLPDGKLQPANGGHGRRCERAAGHNPGRVLCASSCTRQVGVPMLLAQGRRATGAEAVRSDVVTPRSMLASWAGAAGAALSPLYDAHRAFILGARVLHAHEAPVSVLDPGADKTRKAHVRAYARGRSTSAPA